MAGMRVRLRGLLDGAGWSVGLAAVLFVFALLAAILIAQAPESLLWTGQHAVGNEQDGLIVFRWHGQNYSAATTGDGFAKSAGVYFDPANPDDAIPDNGPERAFTGALVGVPALAGVLVLAAGLTRKRRWARRQRRVATQYGGGLDQEFVSRQLENRRGGRPGSGPGG
jgi:hypothetical protein